MLVIMKKIILIIFLFLIATGCGKQEPKLLFSDIKSMELNEIGKINEDIKIFSKTDIQYNTKNGSISLKEALEKHKTTIKKITSKMKKDMALNDGGTIVYKYETNKYNLANKNFYLVICKKINGERISEEDSYYKNQNIYIETDLNKESMLDYCNS